MKVEHNGQTYVIGWQYKNPELEALLQEKGITQEEVKAMKNKKELIDKLGIQHLPKPTITTAILRVEKEDGLWEMGRATTFKNPKDDWDQNEARKWSLRRLLIQLFGDKLERTYIWDEYKRQIGHKYFSNKPKKKQHVAKTI
jgi:hypothetical protein